METNLRGNIQIKPIVAALTWPLRQEIMYPDFTIEQVKLPDDDASQHFGLFLDNQLCGVVSVFVKDAHL